MLFLSCMHVLKWYDCRMWVNVRWKIVRVHNIPLFIFTSHKLFVCVRNCWNVMLQLNPHCADCLQILGAIEKTLIPSLDQATMTDIEGLRLLLTLPNFHFFNYPQCHSTVICPFARVIVCSLNQAFCKVIGNVFPFVYWNLLIFVFLSNTCVRTEMQCHGKKWQKLPAVHISKLLYWLSFWMS